MPGVFSFFVFFPKPWMLLSGAQQFCFGRSSGLSLLSIGEIERNYCHLPVPIWGTVVFDSSYSKYLQQRELLTIYCHLRQCTWFPFNPDNECQEPLRSKSNSAQTQINRHKGYFIHILIIIDKKKQINSNMNWIPCTCDGRTKKQPLTR